MRVLIFFFCVAVALSAAPRTPAQPSEANQASTATAVAGPADTVPPGERYMPITGRALSPSGYRDMCARKEAAICFARPAIPLDIVMSDNVWRGMTFVNSLVNDRVKPKSDIDHWGVPERWSIPTDGYGDCEDYALYKQDILIKNGWPRQALLIAAVFDRKGEGHAVLIVKTDQGEFVLDNMNENILLWSKTGYRFTKRQSQADPNVWESVGIGAVATVYMPH